jgi:hypothetical protein
MGPKNTYTIPMGDVVEVVAETRRIGRGLRTTVKEVPLHSKKGRSGQSSQSQPRAEAAVDPIQSQSFEHPSKGIEESYTLHPMEPYENDMPVFQMEDPQPQASVFSEAFCDICQTSDYL